MLELEGRLAEALPVRLLVPAVGRLLLVGRLLTVGRVDVGRLALAVGRLDMLPLLLPLTDALLLVRPDMLPLLLALVRPSFCRRWLIEPALEPLLLCRTLAT